MNKVELDGDICDIPNVIEMLQETRDAIRKHRKECEEAYEACDISEANELLWSILPEGFPLKKKEKISFSKLKPNPKKYSSTIEMVRDLSGDAFADHLEDKILLKKTQEAIRKHRDQRGDDRCWMDDEELYKVLPEGYIPPLRDSKVELGLCQKFIECRHRPGTTYVSPQRRIEELEEGNKRLLCDYQESKSIVDHYSALESALEMYLKDPSPVNYKLLQFYWEKHHSWLAEIKEIYRLRREEEKKNEA